MLIGTIPPTEQFSLPPVRRVTGWPAVALLHPAKTAATKINRFI
jgi:hypothetical protein